MICTSRDLAAVSDAHVNKIIDGRVWRSKAIAWVQAHPDPAQESEIAKLRDQNEKLAARLEKLEKFAGDNKQVRRTRKPRPAKIMIASEAAENAG